MMSHTRSRRVQIAIASISNVGALSLLGVVLAYWTWVWWAPSPLPPSIAPAESSAHLTAAGSLFGQQGASTVQADAPTGLAVTLLGVMAAEAPGVGYALLKLGAQETRVVRAGGQLAPGIRVERILPQQVILERNGLRETLAWPRAAQAPATTKNVLNP